MTGGISDPGCGARAEPAARRIDQHAVDFAGEAFYLRIILVRDHQRVQVERPERFSRGSDCRAVSAKHPRQNPTLRMHQRAEHQCLPPRRRRNRPRDPCAAVPAIAQHLAAFVLHFDAPR